MLLGKKRVKRAALPFFCGYATVEHLVEVIGIAVGVIGVVVVLFAVAGEVR